MTFPSQTIRESDSPLSSPPVPPWGVVAFVCVAAVVAARTAYDLNIAGAPMAPRYGMADFRDAIYYPVVAFLDGRNPYDPTDYIRTYPVTSTFALYAPHTLVVHLPFGLLTPGMAQSLYFLGTLALVPVLAWTVLMLGRTEVTVGRVFALAALLVASRPGQSTLFLGQYTVTVSLGVCLALAFARSRPWLAAVGIALSVLKPTFGVPLALLLLACGHWRAVVRGAAIAAALAFVPAAAIATSLGGSRSLVELLADNQRAFASLAVFAPDASVTRIDVASLVGRLFGRAAGSTAEPVIALVMLTTAAMAIVHLSRAHGHASVADPLHSPAAARRSDAGAGLVAAIICVTIVACVYHQSYDALLLAVPLATLWSAPVAGHRERLWRAVVIALLAIPLVNYVSTFWFVQGLGIQGGTRTVVTSVNAAAVLLAWLLLVAAALRTSGAARVSSVS